MGKRPLVLVLILVELILIPSHLVNSYPAWKVRRANSTTTFLWQTSIRRRRRYSMKMGPLGEESVGGRGRDFGLWKYRGTC